jgi:hypothetical protein
MMILIYEVMEEGRKGRENQPGLAVMKVIGPIGDDDDNT